MLVRRELTTLAPISASTSLFRSPVAQVVVLTVLSLIFLAGCNLPTPESRDQQIDASASFYVDKIDGSIRPDQDLDEYSLPTSKVYNFQVCVKDMARSKPILNQNFKVLETDLFAQSDMNGCLNWTEKIPFNFLAQSQYIQIKRRLEGMGLHKGIRTIDLAINPWSHGENLTQVLDLSKTQVPNLVMDQKLVRQALTGQGNKPRSLWVESGQILVSEQGFTTSGVNLNIDLRFIPNLKLNNMNQDTIYRPLTAGRFKAIVSIIHTYSHQGQDIRRLLSKTDFLDAQINDGYLNLKTVIQLAVLPTRGQIQLGLELYPSQATEKLSGFEGVYLIGEYDQIKTVGFLRLSSSVKSADDKSNFKIQDYLTVESLVSKKMIEEDNYQRPKIEISPLEFKFLRVGQETTSTREVFFTVKACLRNGIEQKPVRQQTFEVTRFRKYETEAADTISVQSDNNSCINWVERINFKYFDCQRYFRGFSAIRNKDLGMEERLNIAVNPWENLRSIAHDLRYLDSQERITFDCKQESNLKTRLFIEGFSTNTLSYSYQVDSLLNLSIIKKFQLKLEPKILTYSNLTKGRAESERTRDGVYLLKAAVIENQDYQQGIVYVSHAERMVSVMNGTINTELEFLVDDLKALGNRNNLLLTLYALDEQKLSKRDLSKKQDINQFVDDSSGLESTVYVGPFFLNQDEQSRPMRAMGANTPFDQMLETKKITNSEIYSIERIISEGIAQRAALKKSQLEKSAKNRIARDNNFSVINLNNPSSTKDLKQALSLNTELFLLPRQHTATPQYYQSLIQKTQPISDQQLANLLNLPASDSNLAKKLCVYWFNSFMPQQNLLDSYAHIKLTHECLLAAEKDPEAFFIGEKRLLVKEVSRLKYLNGYNNSLSVGTAFNVSQTRSETVSQNVSLSGNAGISYKALDLLSAGVGGSYSLTWSTSNAQSTANNVSVSVSANLLSQRNTFKLTLNRYETCTTYRLNPMLFTEQKTAPWYHLWERLTQVKRSNYTNLLNPNLSDQQKLMAVTRGLLVCEGQERNSPVEVEETFYLINQEASGNQIQDSGDERNRRLFMVLRGNQDYQRFLSAIKSEQKPIDNNQSKTTSNTFGQNQTLNGLIKIMTPNLLGTYQVW